jgi:hypothetical protein
MAAAIRAGGLPQGWGRLLRSIEVERNEDGAFGGQGEQGVREPPDGEVWAVAFGVPGDAFGQEVEGVRVEVSGRDGDCVINHGAR